MPRHSEEKRTHALSLMSAPASLHPLGGGDREAAAWGLSRWQKDCEAFNREQLPLLAEAAEAPAK